MPQISVSRIRVRTDETNQSPVFVVTPHGVIAQVGYSFTMYEEIRDNVNKSFRGLYPQSDVYHKIHLSSWTQGRTGHYLDEAGGVVISNQVIAQPSMSRAEAEALWPVVPETLWTELAHEAFTTWSEQVPEEISIANFLLEARELGEFLPKLHASLSKTVAGGYLQMEFGWLPLFDDLRTLASLTGSVEKRLQHLRSINRKVTRLGFKRKDLTTLPEIRPWVDASASQQLRLSSYDVEFTATARLWADLQGLDDQLAFWRAFAVALGLTNLTKAFWNSVPFSFVVDWFTKAGSRLFDLTTNPFRGDWIVHHESCSLKEQMTVQARENFRPDLNGNPLCGVLTATRYTRLGHLPLDVSAFNTNTLSPKQATLLLALVRTGLR